MIDRMCSVSPLPSLGRAEVSRGSFRPGVVSVAGSPPDRVHHGCAAGTGRVGLRVVGRTVAHMSVGGFVAVGLVLFVLWVLGVGVLQQQRNGQWRVSRWRTTGLPPLTVAMQVGVAGSGS